jgi:hypothetical protein
MSSRVEDIEENYYTIIHAKYADHRNRSTICYDEWILTIMLPKTFDEVRKKELVSNEFYTEARIVRRILKNIKYLSYSEIWYAYSPYM